MWVNMVPLALLVAVFYFAMIRPQQKKAKEHSALLKAVRAGDKIVTSSGIVAIVVTVKEKTLMVRSADAVKQATKYGKLWKWRVSSSSMKMEVDQACAYARCQTKNRASDSARRMGHARLCRGETLTIFFLTRSVTPTCGIAGLTQPAVGVERWLLVYRAHA